jgi:rhodanese-related sulfurtransferase
MKAVMLKSVCLSLIAVSAWAGEKCSEIPGADGSDKAAICEGGKCAVTPKEGIRVTQGREGTISTDGLAALIRAKVPVLIFDARSGKWDDGKRIPGAKSLNAASTPEEVQAAIPDKSALIVTYCGGVKCPASHLLSERLAKDGFQNVVEFPEGIEGWIKAGNPLVEVKR